MQIPYSMNYFQGILKALPTLQGAKKMVLELLRGVLDDQGKAVVASHFLNGLHLVAFLNNQGVLLVFLLWILLPSLILILFIVGFGLGDVMGLRPRFI